MALLPLEELVKSLGRLPGIGPKTAQRLAYYLVKRSREEAEALARAILDAKDKITYCEVCYNFTDTDHPRCQVCLDDRRDQKTICVVEDANDVLVLEHNRLINGVYHVLGGKLSPLDGVSPADLRIDELVDRVQSGGVAEVILALNASTEGEATAEYIQRQLGPQTKVTRLARGLPVGADLDLADKGTLAHALEGRQSF
jgi:recombination protein RecR